MNCKPREPLAPRAAHKCVRPSGVKIQQATREGVGGVKLATRYFLPDDVSALCGVVVLAHGYAEHAGRFDHVIEELVSGGFAVATHDARGHGASTGVPFGTIDNFEWLVDDLVGLATHVHDEHPDWPLFLYGHSMGGLAVLRAAERQQVPVAGLVVTSPAIVPAESIPAPLVAVANLLGRVAPGLKTIALEEGAISRIPEVNAAYSADPLVYRGKITAGTGRQMNTGMANTIRDLAKVTEPILLLHGTADRLTSPKGSLEVVRRIGSADSEIQFYPGAYHELHNEPEAEQVIAHVVSWLQAHC